MEFHFASFQPSLCFWIYINTVQSPLYYSLSFLGWFIAFCSKSILVYGMLVTSKEIGLEFVLGSHLRQREIHFSLLYSRH